MKKRFLIGSAYLLTAIIAISVDSSNAIDQKLDSLLEMANKTNTVNTNTSTPQASINQTTPEKVGLKQGNSSVSSGKNSKAETSAKSSSAKSALEAFTHYTPDLSFIMPYASDLRIWLAGGLMIAYKKLKNQERAIDKASRDIAELQTYKNVADSSLGELRRSVNMQSKQLTTLEKQQGGLQKSLKTITTTTEGQSEQLATLAIELPKLQEDLKAEGGHVNGMLAGMKSHLDLKYDTLSEEVKMLDRYCSTIAPQFDNYMKEEFAKFEEKMKEFEDRYKSYDRLRRESL
ncbi:MAG TPA: hypothetical protein VHA52_03925, partial [Candidatus Babeliaceae bacterium]|nr:hypothetical protein [Candidatus Babeliaceae bacterium]